MQCKNQCKNHAEVFCNHGLSQHSSWYSHLENYNPNYKHETIIRTIASNLVAGDIPQALRQIRSQSPADYECDGLDLKFNWPGGLNIKKSVTTIWRSGKSLFCCEQHRTVDSAILFKVSMRSHWSLDPSFCSCMMCRLVKYFRNWLVYLLLLEWGDLL